MNHDAEQRRSIAESLLKHDIGRIAATESRGDGKPLATVSYIVATMGVGTFAMTIVRELRAAGSIASAIVASAAAVFIVAGLIWAMWSARSRMKVRGRSGTMMFLVTADKAAIRAHYAAAAADSVGYLIEDAVLAAQFTTSRHRRVNPGVVLMMIGAALALVASQLHAWR